MPSPSLGREWIEILSCVVFDKIKQRLPPWGGSGLKYVSGGDVIVPTSLPPWGGSGLKSPRHCSYKP